MSEENLKIDNNEELVYADSKHWGVWDIVGVISLVISILGLLFFTPEICGAFDYVFQDVHQTAVQTFLGAGGIAGAVIASICTGRLLERLGVSDGLVKLIVPFAKVLKINPTVFLPVIYNVLGDATVAARITFPSLRKAGCTKHEMKIAMATMLNVPTAFSTMMVGLVMLNLANVNAVPVLFINLIFPIFVVPLISRIWWRDTKYVPMEKVPKFTPKGNFFTIFCDSAMEGMSLVVNILVPSLAAIIIIISFLTYFGVWQYVEIVLTAFFKIINVYPEAGTLSMVVSPLVGFNLVIEALNSGAVISKAIVISTFLLGNSGCIMNLTFTQLPMMLPQETGLSAGECIWAMLVGWFFKLGTCFLIGFLPF